MQGRLGAWIGSLKANCMQASAELQMIAYYRIMLQNERSNPAVHFSSVPSAALKVVGNELRFAPHHFRLLTLLAAMSSISMRTECSSRVQAERGLVREDRMCCSAWLCRAA